ncbi:MAG: RNA-binding transcriptional accessory protein [Saprospirales bacterium TMED214]|nr:MAG: RNA-binding transcriptional accessory protein [Saprospirales bacterium TMED214]
MPEMQDTEQIARSIAADLKLPVRQVLAAIGLLGAGNTIPFIARYRKEVTQGLDEIALRVIEDAVEKTVALAERKATVIKSIMGQGLMTDELLASLQSCSDSRQLEMLYLPFKPKRRTKAAIARERGLQPLADLLILQEPLGSSRNEILNQFVNPALEVADRDAALQGALAIVAEQWSEDVTLRRWMLDDAVAIGKVTSTVKRGKKKEAGKFEIYFDHREAVGKIPSHRLLAMLRGEDEGLLRIGITMDDGRAIARMKSQFIHDRQFEFHRDLVGAIGDCYERLLQPATQSSVLQNLKEQADTDAIEVFGRNLHELLMASPAGPRVTLGIDPGFRTGCKLAVVDETGKFLATSTIYPTPPRNDSEAAAKRVMEFVNQYNVELIAIGNGTASRETDVFVGNLLKEQGLNLTKVMVSEAGASIYSASEIAIKEFPDLDVTVRGAISIARRLQDPLAELVKTDPKSIGVGQYQHDVNQTRLRKCLDRTVESCVNAVGVDLNMASVSLLSHVAGIGPKLAQNIVAYRDQNGRFENRKELLDVAKLGRKAFEQAAGFLRIRGGEESLDNSAVHPESYTLVGRMAKKLGTDPKRLVGDAGLSHKLNPSEYVDDRFGLPTVIDIISELEKPGRDPRREFKAVQFDDAINSIGDLKAGLVMEGVITNVTHFGAFVDIGVHQDALIHISQLSNSFVKDPNEIVAVGDLVKVKVLEIDVGRKRISVTLKF